MKILKFTLGQNTILFTKIKMNPKILYINLVFSSVFSIALVTFILVYDNTLEFSSVSFSLTIYLFHTLYATIKI